MPKKQQLLPLLTLESRIKRGLRTHLRRLGFVKSEAGALVPPTQTKDCIRSLHRLQRIDVLARENPFVQSEWPRLKNNFADGSEVVPSQVRARLEIVDCETWQSSLFRLASLTWSVPVSKGYGRRMRYLVWDDSNGKLLGLLALGDPVFNLRVRDALIGWSAADRQERLVNLLDTYVLGALPPYNQILGGKLVASLVRTREVRDAFASRYAANTGIISGKKKRPSLVMVTTTSALGRSSLYNRLHLDGTKYFRSVGFTVGWGHFHVPDDLFMLMRDYLSSLRDKYASNHYFGEGPNWRLRAIRKAMTSLGLNPDILHHGVAREVFVCELARNALNFLNGNATRPNYRGLLSVAEVSDLATRRWLIPRAARYPQFQTWRKEQVLAMLDPEKARLSSPPLPFLSRSVSRSRM
jgi:hypothetical protein